MNKSKVAIVTIVSYNYGNRLQNYALQTALERLGAQVVTMRRDLSELKATSLFKTMMHALRNKTKYDKFANFNRRIHWSTQCLCPETKKKINTDLFDYFITGSDQVWNVTFPFISDIEFLSFAPAEKRISYAASFGISHIPEEYRSMVKAGLAEMKGISVRENDGAAIVRSLTDRQVPVVLDPTLLLTSDEWEGVERKPDMDLPDDYIFTYFLGENRIHAFIEEEAAKESRRVVSLDLFDQKVSDANIGPAEFIYLLHHAGLVVTDSFHGSVFSIIFRRPFVVGDRNTDEQKMSSRIDTLLSMLGLEANRYNDSFDSAAVYNTNYDDVNLIIASKREEAIKYLKEQM